MTSAYRSGGTARENSPSLCWANMPSQVLQINTDIDLPDLPMPLGWSGSKTSSPPSSGHTSVSLIKSSPLLEPMLPRPRAGATVRELLARLGHKTERMAIRYQHATLERDVAIAQKLSALTRAVEATSEPTTNVVAIDR